MTPDGDELSALHPSHFSPGVRALSTHLIWIWVGLRVGLDMVTKRKISIITPADN